MIILLALIFLILTENLNVVNVLIAIVVSYFVVFLNKRELMTMEIFKLKTFPKWVLYVVLLVKEVAIANVQVAMIVLSPKMNISPRIVKYESQLQGDMFLTILANSITLTPGTMTVSIDKNVLDIHCLNKNYEDSLKDNLFEKMLLKIEGVQNE
jgi:multicomponent Na+:H+ antiporter subunit E